MQKQFETHYHNVESAHWWFVARREAVHDLMARAQLGPDAKILEIGCSGGIFLDELRRAGFVHVEGIDISEDAVELCRQKKLCVQVMDAKKLDFPDAGFDFIIASDVLEHLPDDAGALREWRRVLKHGGILLVFVPAFMFLWTAHDVANKHQRRYRASELRQRMWAAGFSMERCSYWNSFLFLPITLVRVAKYLVTGGKLPRNGKRGDLFAPPKSINQALLSLLRLENSLLRLGVNWPLGVSVMALGRNAKLRMPERMNKSVEPLV